MKDLLYRSDERIDMLSRQFTGSKLRSQTTESGTDASIGVKTPVVQSNLSTSSKTSDAYSYEHSVIEDIENYFYDAGEVDNLGLRQYIHSTARVRYINNALNSYVAWCGEFYPNEDTLCIILLLGSKHHIIGDYSGKERSYSTPTALYELLSTEDSHEPNNDDSFIRNVSFFLDGEDDGDVTLSCEFFAKVHHRAIVNRANSDWEGHSQDSFNPHNRLKQIHYIYASPIYVASHFDNESRVVSVNGNNIVLITQDECNSLRHGKKGTISKVASKVADILFRRGDTTKNINIYFIDDVMHKLLNAGLIAEAHSFHKEVFAKLHDAGYVSFCEILNAYEDGNEAADILEHTFKVADGYIMVEQ